jgi:very-short-patch-repair endonuclease
MTQTRVTPEMRHKSRAFRHLMTKAENLLWYELRDLKSSGLKFRRQSPIGPYVVDFVCLSAKIVVEVDGDCHETDAGKRHDANRDSYLLSLGYKVLRFDEPDVLANAWHVAQAVRNHVADGRDDPTRPLRGHPPLKGEGNAAPFGPDQKGR